LKGNDQLLAHGLTQEALGKVPLFGNQMQDAEYRRAKNAANTFVLAFMRSTSGAAYGEKERYDHAVSLLPKYGDDSKTLADKAAQRESFLNAEYGGMGLGAQKIADYYKSQRTPQTVKQDLADIELQSLPKTVGKIVTNKHTGEKRMWDGTHWVEK
jgi:hypothetical protein